MAAIAAITIAVVTTLVSVVAMAVMFLMLVMPHVLHMTGRAVIVMTVNDRLVLYPLLARTVVAEQITRAYLDISRRRAMHEARAFVVVTGERGFRSGDRDQERGGKGKLA